MPLPAVQRTVRLSRWETRREELQSPIVADSASAGRPLIEDDDDDDDDDENVESFDKIFGSAGTGHCQKSAFVQ